MDRLPRLVLLGMGAYFVVSGVWPLVHMPSFLAVTGDKVDLWLVRMVGLLAAAIGAALLVAGARRRVSAEIVTLAIGSAISFALIDVLYGRRFSPAYLADAVLQGGFVLVLTAGLLTGRKRRVSGGA